MHKVGELDLPSSEDDLLEAMIYVTRGERWLLGEGGEEEWSRKTKMMTIMDNGTAEGIITVHFGYGVYDEIVEVYKVGGGEGERRGSSGCQSSSSSSSSTGRVSRLDRECNFQ